MSLRGQVSIFVILGIVVAVTLALLIVFSRGSVRIGEIGSWDAESFIESCVRDSLETHAEVALPQGGFVRPASTIRYKGIDVPYVCYNANFYQSCISQYPRYLTTVEEQLTEAVGQDIESCFDGLREEAVRRGYAISIGAISHRVVLKPHMIEVPVNADVSLTKDSSVSSFSGFVTLQQSPLYNLAQLAQEIASQESKFCYFEYVGFMLLYPEFEIRKDVLSESTKIYTLIDTESGKTSQIAVRGCAIPAGF